MNIGFTDEIADYPDISKTTGKVDIGPYVLAAKSNGAAKQPAPPKKDLRIDTEFKSICPRLSNHEYQALEESIRSEGCRDPLAVWQGIVLDGHHRYEICQKHDISFKIEVIKVEDRSAAIQWIIQNALSRRNLTPVQKIELAEKFRDVLEKQAAERKRAGLKQNGAVEQVLASRDDGKVNQQIGKYAGISRETVRKYRVAKPYLQEKELEKLQRGEMHIDRAARIARTRKNEQTREELRQSNPALTAKDYSVFVSDIRKGLPEIEDESIDIIVTDAPYNNTSMPLYGELGKVASRVLKPGRDCVVMVGQYYLPDAIRELGQHLEYQWILTYVLPGVHNQHIDRRVSAGWKPVLWYRKLGESDRKIHVHDKVECGQIHEHIYHNWEQNIEGFKSLMKNFVYEGDLVLDPFVGSGTTGLAAKALKCRFVGSDIDDGCAKIAASRLAEKPESVPECKRIPALDAA